MINKTHFKFYLIFGGLLILVILIILVIPMGNKKTSEKTTVPTPTFLPTGKTPSRFPLPTPRHTPTLIPLRFTGGDLSQDIPPDVKLFSEQKTELRRKAPLELSFGTISFDYENDKFILTLKEPKDQSQTTFNAWLEQVYPAIPIAQFSFIN